MSNNENSVPDDEFFDVVLIVGGRTTLSKFQELLDKIEQHHREATGKQLAMPAWLATKWLDSNIADTPNFQHTFVIGEVALDNLEGWLRDQNLTYLISYKEAGSREACRGGVYKEPSDDDERHFLFSPKGEELVTADTVLRAIRAIARNREAVAVKELLDKFSNMHKLPDLPPLVVEDQQQVESTPSPETAAQMSGDRLCVQVELSEPLSKEERDYYSALHKNLMNRDFTRKILETLMRTYPSGLTLSKLADELHTTVSVLFTLLQFILNQQEDVAKQRPRGQTVGKPRIYSNDVFFVFKYQIDGEKHITLKTRFAASLGKIYSGVNPLQD